MKKFSFRRMWKFTGLLLGETYLNRPWKALLFMSVVITTIFIMACLLNDSDINESLELSTSLYAAFAALQAAVLCTSFLSPSEALNRLLIPASRLEKLVSLYVSSAIVGTVFLLMSFILGSALFNITGLIAFPEVNDGIYILFSNKEFLLICPFVYLWLMPMIVWFSFISSSRQSWKGFCAILAYIIVFMGGIYLSENDSIVPEQIAGPAVAVLLLAGSVLSVLWTYRLLSRYEYKKLKK